MSGAVGLPGTARGKRGVRRMSMTLTPEQQAIVAHPLEPLRVSAGAGTGKTTTIVLRLAALIENGIDPEQALGITFTNKAPAELADHLRQQLPELAPTAREVAATTHDRLAAALPPASRPRSGSQRVPALATPAPEGGAGGGGGWVCERAGDVGGGSLFFVELLCGGVGWG